MQEKKENRIKFNSDWEKKYVRESWTFPFGSLVNGWALLNQGKIISLQEYISACKTLHKEAMNMTTQALVKSQEPVQEQEEFTIDLNE
jgi:hypothetical protein